MRKILSMAILVAGLTVGTVVDARDGRPPVWTGAYVGAHVGGGTSTFSVTGVDGSEDISGWLGGVHAGANFQTGNFVLGGEVDYSYADVEKTVTDGADRVTIGLDQFYSIRARAGVLMTPEVLVYGTAGYGWGQLNASITDGGDTVSTSRTAEGFVFGGGLEYMLSNNIALRGEVLHYGLEYTNGGDTIDISTTVGRAGLSYKF